MIKVKRVYDPFEPEDGKRILIERKPLNSTTLRWMNGII
jgi:uncharacterized protein YeaO (DUF488 family)